MCFFLLLSKNKLIDWREVNFHLIYPLKLIVRWRISNGIERQRSNQRAKRYYNIVPEIRIRIYTIIKYVTRRKIRYINRKNSPRIVPFQKTTRRNIALKSIKILTIPPKLVKKKRRRKKKTKLAEKKPELPSFWKLALNPSILAGDVPWAPYKIYRKDRKKWKESLIRTRFSRDGEEFPPRTRFERSFERIAITVGPNKLFSRFDWTCR